MHQWSDFIGYGCYSMYIIHSITLFFFKYFFDKVNFFDFIINYITTLGNMAKWEINIFGINHQKIDLKNK